MNFLSKLSIRGQLVLLSGLLLCIIFIIGGKAILDTDGHIQDADDVFIQSTRPLGFLLNSVDHVHKIRSNIYQIRFHPEKRNQLIADLPNVLKDLEYSFGMYYGTDEEWIGEATEPGEYETAKEIRDMLPKYRELIMAFHQYKDSPIATEESIKLAYSILDESYAILTLLRKLSDLAIQLTYRLNTEQKELGEHQKMVTILLMVGSVLIGSFLASLFIRKIRKELNNVVSVASSIANKNLSTHIPPANKNTETGQLTIAFSTMQDALRTVLDKINTSSNHLSGSVHHLMQSTRKISTSSRKQTEAANSCAAAVEELSVSIDAINEKASSTRAIAQEARNESIQSSQVIAKTSEQVQSIAATIQTSVKLAEELGDRSQQIDIIVNTIRDIADQTNLLALNAAIEAARAGETGRGFAVVADEVRKLAERTTASTEEIGNVINGIRAGIETMVGTMKDSEAQVSDGVTMAEDARTAIEKISGGAEHVLSLIGAIADALREQSVASQSVARNVETIAAMAEENGSAISQVSNESDALDQLAENLNQEVVAFRLN